MKTSAIRGLAAISCLMAASVYAQTVQLAMLANVDGKIMVNKGKGFVAAQTGTALSTGDRVIALHGSHAAVVYKDGCVTELQENSLLALDGSATCGKGAVRTGASSATKQPLRFAQAIGAPANDGSTGKTDDDRIPIIFWVGGALVGGAAIYNATKKSGDNNPVSPQ